MESDEMPASNKLDSPTSDREGSTKKTQTECTNLTMVEEFCMFCFGTLFSNDEGDSEELLCCSDCLKYSHPSCLEMPVIAVENTKLYNWQCNDCKDCFQCKKKNKEKSIIICDHCDRGFHTFCLDKKPSRISKGYWKCPVCQRLETTEKQSEQSLTEGYPKEAVCGLEREKVTEEEMNLAERNACMQEATVDAGLEEQRGEIQIEKGEKIQKEDDLKKDTQREDDEKKGTRKEDDQKKDTQKEDNKKKGTQKEYDQKKDTQKEDDQKKDTQKEDDQKKDTQKEDDQKKDTQKEDNKKKGTQKEDDQKKDTQKEDDQKKDSQEDEVDNEKDEDLLKMMSSDRRGISCGKKVREDDVAKTMKSPTKKRKVTTMTEQRRVSRRLSGLPGPAIIMPNLPIEMNVKKVRVVEEKSNSEENLLLERRSDDNGNGGAEGKLEEKPKVENLIDDSGDLCLEREEKNQISLVESSEIPGTKSRCDGGDKELKVIDDSKTQQEQVVDQGVVEMPVVVKRPRGRPSKEVSDWLRQEEIDAHTRCHETQGN
eukprot:gene11204-12379_t